MYASLLCLACTLVSLSQEISLTKELLSDDASFFLLNTYTAGLSHTILNFMVKEYVLKNKFNGDVFTDEIGLKVTHKDIILPCGNTTIWKRDNFEKIK